jgi:hypothetical protein
MGRAEHLASYSICRQSQAIVPTITVFVSVLTYKLKNVAPAVFVLLDVEYTRGVVELSGVPHKVERSALHRFSLHLLSGFFIFILEARKKKPSRRFGLPVP